MRACAGACAARPDGDAIITFRTGRGIAAVAKGCAAANGLRGVIQPFAARDSEVGQRRPRTVAQTTSGAAPVDVEALSTVCLRR